MSEQTPSQAEGERQDDATEEETSFPAAEAPRTTPSQAEGDDDSEEETGDTTAG
ncbi:hypothetical protein [Streptomyces sp. NPDC006552]|uniref:hypothetical protein n=1 Tax=Streptomyces sp. NPDC006552 TaxID=3157179 RepID=UPI0033ACD313